MSTNVSNKFYLFVAFTFKADTPVDLVLIPPLFLFLYTSLSFVFNYVADIKSLPYVCTRVYSPIYRFLEYLPYTTMFRASRFPPPVPIFNQHIFFLSSCPHEHIFFSIYIMSFYYHYHFSSKRFLKVFLFSFRICMMLVVFFSEYFYSAPLTFEYFPSVTYVIVTSLLFFARKSNFFSSSCLFLILFVAYIYYSYIHLFVIYVLTFSRSSVLPLIR